MRGNRMSSLPIAKFCSAAGKLDSPSQRSAVMSQAFHSLCAGHDDLAARLSKLTDDEHVEIQDWHVPNTLVFQGVELQWADAEKEVEVMVGDSLAKCDDPEVALSVGHVDAYWIAEIDGLKTAVILDLKRSHFTAEPDSLQLEAYGLSVMITNDCQAYVCGIWSLTEGTWRWGEVRLADSWETMDIAGQVLAAMENADGEFNPGEHCSGCWSRWQCPAHMLPMQDPIGALEPFTGPGEITSDQAREALMLYQSAKSLMDTLKKNLEDYAEQAGGIRDGRGKVWRRIVGKKPQQSFNSKAFKADHPDLYSEYVEEKPPRNQGFRWCNEEQ